MIFIYILLILLAAFPLALTIWRMRRETFVKKNGIYTNAVITNISVLRSGRGATVDLLSLEYNDRATGQVYTGRATVVHQTYKVGDPFTVIYLSTSPSTYAVDTKKGYWIVLIFCILLFLFILFAVYKINEMVKTGH